MIVPNKNSNELEHDSDKVTIRPMTNDDISLYCTLFQTVFAEAPWKEVWTISQIEKIITRHMRKKGFTGMAATTNNGTVGYLTGFRIWYIPSLFYLDQLFVKQEYQGLKIGKRLLAEAERYLKNKGVSRIFLFTKPHTGAEQFYTKNAYASWLRAVRINGKLILCKPL